MVNTDQLNQWLWDIIDEFVYQFRSFCEHRAKTKNKTEQETTFLRLFDQVEERPVSIEELLEADEVFCTGYAVGLSPIGSITYLGKRVSYQETGLGGVSEQLYQALSNIQMGLAEENRGWIVTLK
ncbi:putative branched-chain-amino-acid transaminase [Rosa chinensis]|uniref:Putative branched-chain-amino-acid transaminase n=1 Tax=Rosa chinensis TaxID=74649 RepID=A0A2P6R7R6_ROSCH|nr:putative branched-chain-amino-acid transaminase [Rosa chinensis]